MTRQRNRRHQPPTRPPLTAEDVRGAVPLSASARLQHHLRKVESGMAFPVCLPAIKDDVNGKPAMVSQFEAGLTKLEWMAATIAAGLEAQPLDRHAVQIPTDDHSQRKAVYCVDRAQAIIDECQRRQRATPDVPRCVECDTEVPPGEALCAGCGAALDNAMDETTVDG